MKREEARRALYVLVIGWALIRGCAWLLNDHRVTANRDRQALIDRRLPPAFLEWSASRTEEAVGPTLVAAVAVVNRVRDGDARTYRVEWKVANPGSLPAAFRLTSAILDEEGTELATTSLSVSGLEAGQTQIYLGTMRVPSDAGGDPAALRAAIESA